MVHSMNISTEPGLGPIFTHAEAIDSGMSQSDLNHFSHQRVMHGHYSSTESTPLHLRAQAVLGIAGQDAVICGATALRLRGVDLPGRLVRDTRVWIQVPEHQTWPRRPEVRLVRSEHARPTGSSHGLPILDLPSCWVQLASESTVDELVEVADAMMRRKHSLVRKAELSAAVTTHKGSPGIVRARTALHLSREGTDSIPETDLRLLLVRGGLPTPVVNLAIIDDWGRIIHILDLAYEKPKLAIEYDGAYHTGSRAQMNHDAVRRRTLEDQGWRVITVTSADMITDPEGIVTSVRKALSR